MGSGQLKNPVSDLNFLKVTIQDNHKPHQEWHMDMIELSHKPRRFVVKRNGQHETEIGFERLVAA